MMTPKNSHPHLLRVPLHHLPQASRPHLLRVPRLRRPITANRPQPIHRPHTTEAMRRCLAAFAFRDRS